MGIDIFSPCHISLKFDYTPPPPPPGGEKWVSGFFTKLEPWQVLNTNGTLKTTSLNEIFDELRTTPALRGIKWVINWGEVDKGGATSNWNMLVINELVRRLHGLRQETPSKKKYLFLAISFKADTIADLLPPDMRVTGGYTPSVPSGYGVYRYAWPYGSSTRKADGTYPMPQGYYLKTWDQALVNRYSAFCAKLANHVVPATDGETLDAGDYLYMFSSLESATQPLYDSAFPGWTLTNHEDGVFGLVRQMKNSLPNTMITISLNYARPFLTRTIPQLPGLSIGINTPNGNQSTGLIAGGTNPGILTYFQDPELADSIVLNSEMQGDDFCCTNGLEGRRAADDAAKLATPNWAAVDAAYDFPGYKSLYLRHRDLLNAHIVVVQRNYPFWLGGTLTEEFTLANNTKTNHTFPGTRPSFLQFLKTDPDVNANAWAGFNNVSPLNWI